MALDNLFLSRILIVLTTICCTTGNMVILDDCTVQPACEQLEELVKGSAFLYGLTHHDETWYGLCNYIANAVRAMEDKGLITNGQLNGYDHGGILMEQFIVPHNQERTTYFLTGALPVKCPDSPDGRDHMHDHDVEGFINSFHHNKATRLHEDHPPVVTNYFRSECTVQPACAEVATIVSVLKFLNSVDRHNDYWDSRCTQAVNKVNDMEATRSITNRRPVGQTHGGILIAQFTVPHNPEGTEYYLTTPLPYHCPSDPHVERGSFYRHEHLAEREADVDDRANSFISKFYRNFHSAPPSPPHDNLERKSSDQIPIYKTQTSDVRRYPTTAASYKPETTLGEGRNDFARPNEKPSFWSYFDISGISREEDK